MYTYIPQWRNAFNLTVPIIKGYTYAGNMNRLPMRERENLHEQ